MRILLPAAAKAGIDTNAVVGVLTKALLAAMVGARIAYVLNHLDSFRDDPLESLRLWEGGLSLLGSHVAAGLVGVWSARRAPVRRLVDLAAPSLAVGIAMDATPSGHRRPSRQSRGTSRSATSVSLSQPDRRALLR